jgi:hypothetical protein
MDASQFLSWNKTLLWMDGYHEGLWIKRMGAYIYRGTDYIFEGDEIFWVAFFWFFLVVMFRKGLLFIYRRYFWDGWMDGWMGMVWLEEGE